MSVRVLIDTSYLVALLDEKDVHHSTAAAIHEGLGKRGAMCVYLDCVVNETATVLSRRALERKMDPAGILRKLRHLIPADMIDWTGSEWPRLWEKILDQMTEQKGRLSFIDSLIVIVAEEAEIKWVAGFDRNFDDVKIWKRIGRPQDLPEENGIR